MNGQQHSIRMSEESIYDILNAIRKKPGIYIATPSINRLDAFIVGYTAGLGRAGVGLRDKDHFHRFHDWIAQRLGFGGSASGWCNMIRERSTSEADAFDRFYLLLDEFTNDSDKARP
jgi:hypothetical protein